MLPPKASMLPQELVQSLCLALESTINAVLRHDPALLQQMAQQNGRIVGIQVAGYLTVYLRLSDSGLGLIPELSDDHQPDVLMIGTLSDFLQLAQAKDKANQLINSHIELQGDSELAIFLTQLMQTLDIDWEALISPLTGGLVAHQMGQTVRGFLRWGQQTWRTQRMAIKDFVEDEAQLVTPKPLLDDFATAVDDIRLATDRLSARIQQLENRQTASKTGKDH